MAITKVLLYGGETTLYFDSFRHRYLLDGKTPVPSVTTVLSVIAKPALVNWAANMAVDSISASIQPGVSYDELQLSAIFDSGRRAHWQKKVDAGNIGSFVHRFVEGYIKGENPKLPVNKTLRSSVEKFLAWVEEHKVTFSASEQIVYSPTLDYVGTLDFICRIDGSLYMGDLKTSSGIYDEYKAQVAAYRFARSQEYKAEKYKGQLILRISRDGEFEFWQGGESDYKMGLNVFSSALALYRSLEEIKTK